MCVSYCIIHFVPFKIAFWQSNSYAISLALSALTSSLIHSLITSDCHDDKSLMAMILTKGRFAER